MRIRHILNLLFCLLLLGAGQVFADDAADIQKLEQDRFVAYVKGDVAVLDKIFADDMVYIHSSGIADPKSAVIQSFASGDLKISRFDGEDIKVRSVGNVMISSGLVHVELVNKGNAAKFDLRYSAVFARQGGQWRMVHYQGGRLPAKS